MKNKILTLTLMALTLTGSALAQNIAARERRQQNRIGSGIRSGQLTPREAARLERQEARLHARIRRDRRDGGGLSPTERARITERQDQLSRQIYRQKHDGQYR